MNRSDYLYIDSTPDEGYPLRILEAYRRGCDVIYSSSSTALDETSPVMKIMNDAQRKRAELLDKAIERLKK
jgi:hypothetical protein